MSKPDLSKIVSDVQKLYKKDDVKASRIGLGDNLRTLADTNFLVMPEWWQQATNTRGIPFGGYVMLAGDSDSGKTSAAIEAMKAAQQAEMSIIYVETENKTTTQDLKNWGVDPAQVILVKSTIAEEAFDLLFKVWDSFTKNYPSQKLLVVFDSIDNVISKHDIESDQSDTNQKPGGKGRSNRVGINKLVARSQNGHVATLLINYTYDNIGSPGKTNAGGKALNLFSSLTFQTSRKSWIEGTVKGQKIRKGARVVWKLFKNHIDKQNPGPKVVELDITSEGIKVAGVSEE